MRGRLIALLLVLFATIVVGCGDPDLEGAPVITAVDPTCLETRVFGGVTDSDSCGNDAVVQVFVPDIGDGTPAACTGALVSKNLVLTARHCVAHMPVADVKCGDGKSPPRFAPAVDAKTITVRFGSEGTKGEVGVKETILPSDDALCGADIALLILTEDIAPSTAKPLAVRLDEPARAGEKIKAYGFGLRESGVAGHRYRNREAFPILRTGPADPTKDGRPALTDYEIETGPAFCSGDSGGPAVEAESGEIVAVISRFIATKGNPEIDCKNETGFFYTGVSGYAHLFERARRAGAAWTTKETKVPQMLGAEDCGSGDACASKLCAVDTSRANAEEKTFCTAKCVPGLGADCPADWTCQPMDVAVTRGPQGICVPVKHGTISLRTAPRARVERMQTTEGYSQGCSASGARSTTSLAWTAALVVVIAGVVRRRSLRDALRSDDDARAP